MKRCPRCGQGYTDSTINFCLNDGELLAVYSPEEPRTIFSDDSPGRFTEEPPTVTMDPARVTNPTNWPRSTPPVPWQSQTPGAPIQPYGAVGFVRTRDQTLPTIALILGLVSIVTVCCYGGIYLGAPAAVVGFIGMKNADSDPNRYAGRGMAIAGLVIGAITFLISMVILFVAVVAS